MATKTNGKGQKIGWIGAGRMGSPMAERLIKAGFDVTVWNRTRAKAEPLEKLGAKVVEHLSELRDVDVLFSIVSTGKDVQDVLYGKNGVCSQGGKIPPIVVDCSTISVEDSAAVRDKLKQLGADFVAAPVSGNAKVIKAGRLSAVVSGVDAACKAAMPLIEVIAPQGVSYVGEGELARVCKIAHNVMLGVVIENLIEIMLLTNKMGVPRHAFLAFLNNGVMGSMFTRYKSPALGQSRLDHDVHAGTPAQGPRPRSRARPRDGCADAGHRRDARSAAEPFRRRHAAKKSGRISAEGLRRAGRNHGARRRHEADQREQERAERPRKLKSHRARKSEAGRRMKVDGKAMRTIWVEPDGWSVGVIDQTALPHRFVTARLTSLADAAHAIRAMVIRGAPLIGVDRRLWRVPRLA